ncbi:hypothetical protein CYMTET_15371 [Cymbomonas tetramitiformis]|uniref:Uncharacterized protein n=1 Tax=Cymbomonas tetramitiformis TaxID=36881 RepID=A0AAE0GEQ1_9CHLO|nr:hypothetical protein CYMTET_15371 [Cymbomonas tetramitiformis]
MFWRSAGFAQPSPIEGILDRGDFTLEEILEEDDVIQECKALNSRLIAFMKEKDNTEKLIRYLVEPPAEDASVQRRFKFPYLACEILTCEIDAVFTTIFDNTELLDQFFSLLDGAAPLPAVLAGYFAKVMSSLLTRRTTDCMNYLKVHQELLTKLVAHLGTTSIAEVVMQLVGADEQIVMFNAEALQWLGETVLLELILDSLAPEKPSSVHANAAEVLTAIARTLPSTLATQLASPMYLQRLFQHAAVPGNSLQGLVLDVCMALLDPKRAVQAASAGFMDPSDSNCANIPGPPATVVQFCVHQLEFLVAELPTEGDEKTQATTYGTLAPPLGTLRLKVVDFLSVLVRAIAQRNPELLDELQEELIRVDALHKCLTLFFEFPFNSLLHNYVDTLVMSVLESGQEGLLSHLLQRCQLLTALATAPETVMPKDGKLPWRAGYMGHVTRLGNRIRELALKETVLQTAIEEDTTWKDWVAAGLRDQNTLENLGAWKCGRPSQLEDCAADSSDNDDDLRHDFSLGSMSNNISEVFHRYAEEKDEDGEDEGDGFIDSSEVLSSLDFPGSEGRGFGEFRRNKGDSDSSDDSEGEDGAVAPVGAFSADDDEVLLVTSEDEEDDEIDAQVYPAGVEPSILMGEKPDDSMEILSPLAQLFAPQSATGSLGGEFVKVEPAEATEETETTEEAEETSAQFNTFNFWKVSNYDDLVPDDA